MVENFSEKIISNPKQELKVFKNTLEKKSFSNFGNSFEKLSEEKQSETVENAFSEHAETSTHLLSESYSKKQEKAEAIVLKLSPDEDDERMSELLGLVEENGILNTINAIEKVDNFHIKDDFHRFLVQYIKSGYQTKIDSNSELYPGLNMTLFEVSLPEDSSQQEKEKALETLLSSMEQFYAGMFSVSENGGGDNNYYSIEIAYPQGREEVVFFCAIPDEKKNIFKNQVLAIFPSASVKESTNDYNIFNKSENIAYSEAFFTKPQSLPIKTYKKLGYDPLNILLQSFSNLEKSEGAAVQIVLSPATAKVNDKIVKVLDKISKGEDIEASLNLGSSSYVGKFIDVVNSIILSSGKKEKEEIKDSEKRSLVSQELKDKNSSRFYKTNIRLISAGNNDSHANSILSELESAFHQLENPVGNGFEFKKYSGSDLKKKIKEYTFRIFNKKDFLFLNTSELTTIFHFPEVSLNAGDILSTSSFSSAGVSKKISDGSKVEELAEVEEGELRSRSTSENLQQVEQVSETLHRENLPKEIFQDPTQTLKKEPSAFVLERPDDSWVENNSDFSKYLDSNKKQSPSFESSIEQKEELSEIENYSNNMAPQKEISIEDVGNKQEKESPEQSGQKLSSQQNLGDASFSQNKNILLGYNSHQGLDTNIYMKAVDRMRHMYVIGKSGVGKTNILKNMIIQDIQNGEGCCFIDPHGSDIEDILSQIPPERHEDVIYFDPTNTKRPMGMNMLEYDPAFPEQKTFVVDELFSIFRKLYAGTPESMGPAFEQYFRNATLLVLEHPESGCTMIEISRVLSDEAFRNLKLKHCKNMIVKQFWEKIATQAGGESELANIVPYITNKFDVFLANDFMRPIIAQEKSAFNFRDIMDNKKILLVNLSKGKLGELNSNLIGLILVGKILMSALSRVDSLDKNLPPFYLYIDEFQNVTTDSISQILSEARKYKLSLNIAHQYIKQIDEGIRDAVFGNVGSMAVFRVGPEDAEFLEKQFAPTFTATDILNLNNFNAYLKILVDGELQKPFNITTVAPKEGNMETKEMLKKLGSEKYGRDREDIEREVNAKFAAMF